MIPLILGLKACRTRVFLLFFLFLALYDYIPKEIRENYKFRIVFISEGRFHWKEVLTVLYNISFLKLGGGVTG